MILMNLWLDIMIERLPQKIDHCKYTDQGVILEGVITPQTSSKNFFRFHESILEQSSDIMYHLEFDTDLLDNRYVVGTISTQVILQCQRCLDNFTFDIHCTVSTAFASNEAQEKKAEESNYNDILWIPRREYLDPNSLIEDELLLALPQIAMHKLSQCSADVVFLDDKDTENIEQKDNNPFAILKQLKK